MAMSHPPHNGNGLPLPTMAMSHPPHNGNGLCCAILYDVLPPHNGNNLPFPTMAMCYLPTMAIGFLSPEWQ